MSEVDRTSMPEIDEGSTVAITRVPVLRLEVGFRSNIHDSPWFTTAQIEVGVNLAKSSFCSHAAGQVHRPYASAWKYQH